MGEIESRVKTFLDKIKKEDKKINAFLELNPDILKEAKALDAKKGKKGRLYGKVIGVKSNINVKGLTASCASKVLENYKSTYDATVIEKIKAEDGLIIGMLNCDEFASGSTGELSAFGPTDNPVCPGFVPGGSSSGPAAAVAAGFCDMSLGSETGCSIRVPASFCNVVGVRPSYGFVSRHGLIDLAMSLDQIGPFANTVEDAALLLDVIRGKDENDTQSVASKKVVLKKPTKVRVGIVRVKGVDERIQQLVDEQIKTITKKLGWHSKEVSIKCVDLGIQTYFPLVYTEFYSATRRLDGRKYGKKIEDAAGPEVLRRIFGGSEIAHAEHAGQYYHKTLAVREILREEFTKAFKTVDCIMMPVSPLLPWKIGKDVSFDEYYLLDALTAPSSLSGMSGISVPVGSLEDEGVAKPVGLQIICDKGAESKLLSIARDVEKIV